jgi:hypothetical protein
LPHLLRVLGRGLAREGPEILDEVSLVEIAALLSQSSQIGVRIEHEASLGLLEAERAGEELR